MKIISLFVLPTVIISSAKSQEPIQYTAYNYQVVEKSKTGALGNITWVEFTNQIKIDPRKSSISISGQQNESYAIHSKINEWIDEQNAKWIKYRCTDHRGAPCTIRIQFSRNLNDAPCVSLYTEYPTIMYVYAICR